MYPFPLLPTVPDNLENMGARNALLYQNTFMKNTLIRALNIIFEIAPKIKASHPAFSDYMAYIETVCDMLGLHVEADDIFFEALAQQCSEVALPSKERAADFQKDLSSLRNLARDWTKNTGSYQYSLLQDCFKKMETTIVEILHKQSSKFKGDSLPKSISNDKLAILITENMIWLGTKVDISILLPFCISHHDPKTSKYWPPVTPDAIQAIPYLAKAHPRLWKFAPFDPVTQDATKLTL